MSPPADGRIDQLIDGLVRDARPVRRLWHPTVRLSLWLGVLIVATLVAITGLQPAVVERRVSVFFVGELVCLGAATIAAARIAIRAAVPGLDDGLGRAFLVASIVAGTALSLGQTRLAIGVPPANFIAAGIPCVLSSIVIAVCPASAIVWAIGRGAPLRPAWAGAIGGLAAATWAYVLMQLRCRLDETAHVVVWHGVPVAIVAAASAAITVVVARARRARVPPPV
jgi:hypothetical protein